MTTALIVFALGTAAMLWAVVSDPWGRKWPALALYLTGGVLIVSQIVRGA